MRALLYGVKPEDQPEPTGVDEDNRLLRSLARTPMRFTEMEDPGFLPPDWVVTKPRLTGICGSDSKQVFMDFGDVRGADNPMKAFFSLPQVLGHEVVADAELLVALSTLELNGHGGLPVQDNGAEGCSAIVSSTYPRFRPRGSQLVIRSSVS